MVVTKEWDAKIDFNDMIQSEIDLRKIFGIALTPELRREDKGHYKATKDPTHRLVQRNEFDWETEPLSMSSKGFDYEKESVPKSMPMMAGHDFYLKRDSDGERTFEREYQNDPYELLRNEGKDKMHYFKPAELHTFSSYDLSKIKTKWSPNKKGVLHGYTSNLYEKTSTEVSGKIPTPLSNYYMDLLRGDITLIPFPSKPMVIDHIANSIDEVIKKLAEPTKSEKIKKAVKKVIDLTFPNKHSQNCSCRRCSDTSYINFYDHPTGTADKQ